jgi:hypothetical protein
MWLDVWPDCLGMEGFDGVSGNGGGGTWSMHPSLVHPLAFAWASVHGWGANPLRRCDFCILARPEYSAFLEEPFGSLHATFFYRLA